MGTAPRGHCDHRSSHPWEGGGKAYGRPDAVETIQLSAGTAHTVVTEIAVPGHGSLALAVSADDVSPGVVLVQTRQAAEGLREHLAAGE